MIDLHCHTNNSDGTWETKELLEKAEKQKKEQIKILEQFCEENNLLMSGGSDCHGEKK